MYLLSRLILLSAFAALLASVLAIAVALSPWSWLLLALYVFAKLAKKGGMALWKHGTARWADTSDMKRAGMLSGNGLILGRAGMLRPGLLGSAFKLIGLRNSKQRCRDFLAALRFMRPETPLVRMPPGNVHTVVFAPPGAGKSTGFVMPWLLTNPDSAFVIDFKGELAAQTAEARRRMGHHVVVLDPFHVYSTSPDRFNPMTCIDKGSHRALDDIRALAAAWVVRTGMEHDEHWNSSAEVWLGAMAALVTYDAPPNLCNPQSIKSILADPGRLEPAIKRACDITKWCSTPWASFIARWAAQMLHPSEKERGSILSTANRHLAFLDSVPVAESMDGSTYDPADLRKKKMTVYAILPAVEIGTQSGLLRGWISSHIRAVVKQGIGEKRLVHFLLDEAAAVGRMEVLAQLVDKYRGYGLRAQFYYQSAGQLSRCWPEDKGTTLLGCCSAVYLATNDTETAEAVSKRLGAQTVEIESYGGSSGESRSRPAGSFASNQGSDGSSANDSYNVGQMSRPLLRPEEVLQLPPRTAITFMPGMRPVITHTIRFFEERFKPGMVRRAFGAFKVLAASLIVLGISAALAVALASIERRPVRSVPQQAPAKAHFEPDIFGGK